MNKKTVLGMVCGIMVFANGLMGLDLWRVVHGQNPSMPSYKLQVNNMTQWDIDLGTLGIYTSAGNMTVLNNGNGSWDLTEMNMQDVVYNIDNHISMHYPNEWQLQFPGVYNAPVMLDYMYDWIEPMTPGTPHKLVIHVEFCMENRCDVNMNHPEWNGTPGYVILHIGEEAAIPVAADM